MKNPEELSLSLYSIEKELRETLDSIFTSEEEVLADKSVVIQQLNELLVSKVDAVASYRISLDDYLGWLELKIDELKERKEKVIKRIENFDKYVDVCLSLNQKTKLLGKSFTITKRKPAKVVKIIDESKIPIEFIKVPKPKPMIMKSEIAQALKNGQVVDGAELVDSEEVSISYRLK